MKKGIIRKITACLLTVAMCVGLCPGFTANARELELQSASNLSNPRIEKDSGMTAGQKVTWDCVWFGSYPQAEVVPSADNYTAVDESLLKSGDINIIEDSSLYNELRSASWWGNNDITVGGNKYRRVKRSDATYTGTGSHRYNWSDFDTYSYFKYEPIKWRVLKVDGNQAFLLSDIALDDQKYNPKYADEGITWETGAIRSWLNGYGASSNKQKIDYSSNNFIGSAFSGDERSAIAETLVRNSDDGGNGGNDTRDKIFLLSRSDVCGDKALRGFVSSEDTCDEARRSKSSAYAMAMGASVFSEYQGSCEWWLRSPGDYTNFAASVRSGGYAFQGNHDIICIDYGVRAALNLDLSSNLHTYAGTVCSDGTEDETGGSAGGGDPVDPDPEEPDTKGPIAEFTLDKEAAGGIGDALVIYGTLKPVEEAKVSKDFWLSEINDIEWTSSNPEIVDSGSISCTLSTFGINFSYVGLKAAIFPTAEGEAVITGKTAGGLTAQCKITVEESEEAEREREFDESLYRAKVLYDFYDGKDDSGMNYDFNSDTPSKILYSIAKENGLAASAELWDSMKKTLDLAETPSGILDADEVFTKKNMYEGIIFAVFQEASDELTFTEKEVHKNAKELLGVIKTDMLVGYGIKMSELTNLSEADPEVKKLLFEVMDDCLKKNNKFMKALNGLQGALKCADTMDTIQEYAEHCANCIAISSMSESYKQVLRDMLAACPADNPDLKNALKECEKIMNEQFEKFKLELTSGTILLAGKEIARWGMDKIWSDMVLTAWSQCPGAAVFWAAYKTGAFAAESIFHTSDIAEKTLKMSAMLEVRELLKKTYEKEKAAYAKEKNTGNAQAYLSSVDVFYNYLDEDCKTALSFTDTVTGSLAGKLQAFFDASSGAELKKSIESIQSSYKLGYGQCQTLWLYELENDYPGIYKDYKDTFEKLHEKFFIHCPVDVYIKDSTGEVVASVVDNVPYCKEGEPFTVVADGDEKEIWVYGDEQYSVSYVGNGIGKMDITVQSYDNQDQDSQGYGDNNLVRTVKYDGLPLKKGTEYTSNMNLASSKDGYELKNGDDQEIGWSADSAETGRKSYTLKLDHAYLTGEDGIGFEGEFYPGEKVTVYASIPKDAVFREWKADTEEVWILDSDGTKITFIMPGKDVKMSALYDGKNNGGVEEKQDPPSDKDNNKEKKEEVRVSAITLSGISRKIAAGKKIKLTADVTPSNASDKTVVWSSSNSKAATVSSSGIVTMNKKSGGKSVVITAAARDGSGVKASYKITSMKGAVKKVAISGKKTVKAGKTLKLKGKVSAAKKANKKLKWTSSNTAYATVSSSGKVKAQKAGKGKKVKITAMATDGSGKKKSVTIKIR